MKFILAVLALTLSLSSIADDCASTISGLKELVGNPYASMHWVENSDKKPLNLDLSQGDGVIRLKLTAPKGEWANITGVVCKTGPESYVARVASLKWGPQAPAFASLFKIKVVKIELPSQTELDITAKGMNFNFKPR